MAEHKEKELARPGSGKRTGLSPRPVYQVPQASAPTTPVPDAEVDEDDIGDWNDHTPITSPKKLYDAVGKTSAMVKHLVSEMPELRKHVHDSVTAAQNAQREAFDAKNEAILAKQRIEDVRKRVEDLEPVKVSEAATQVKINGLTEKINAGSSKRRWLNGIIVGLVLALLSSAGGAIWWASQVDSNVQHEQERRTAADNAITERIETRPTRDEVLGRDELKALREELVRQRESGPTLRDWLNTLPPAKRLAAERLIDSEPADAQ
jgi:hypothetical protein